MIRDAHYREKLRHRGRGVDDLERRIGGVLADIDERLRRHDRVRVLELGCGYGTAMLELAARYGSRICVTGINRVWDDGNPGILLRNARERGLVLRDDEGAALPSIVHGDVANGLPFAARSFDLVYSQVAWLYFGNKIGVIQEVVRVLDDGGGAKIDADEILPALPPEYARLVEIWDGGRLLPFADYLRRFGMALLAAPDGAYLRIEKVDGFGAGLARVAEIDVSRIHRHWDGIKCVYSTAGGT